MEFTQYKCPVCNEQFKSGDDIVVCPECGAPHHRECYEKNEHCFYADKHSEDFSFEETYSENNNDSEKNDGNTTTCKKCGFENEKSTFYCLKCGFPLNEQDRNQNYQNTQNTSNGNNSQPFNQGVPPFGFGTTGAPFDPMAGINSEEPIADNVTAGEMSKFVGKNTPYFMIVFNRIKKFGGSRFNFAAFLFSGVYFLYRKMIAIGVILTLLVIGLTVGEAFIQLMPEYQELISRLLNMQNGAQMFYSFSISSNFSMNEILFMYSPYLLSLLKGIIMFVCGFTANRAYYKHCTKKINLIKTKVDSTNINKELENCGGVNLALAISFEAAFIIISYIPLLVNF